MFKRFRNLFKVDSTQNISHTESLISYDNDLNHPKVKFITHEIADQIGLSTNLQNFIFAESRHECFDFKIERLEGSWTCNIPETMDCAYAIWSCNADQTLVCIENDKLSFWFGFHDDPDAYMIAKTEQGLLFNLFVSIYESERYDAELKEIARGVSFNYLDELIEWRSNLPELADYCTELDKIIEKIDTNEIINR